MEKGLKLAPAWQVGPVVVSKLERCRNSSTDFATKYYVSRRSTAVLVFKTIARIENGLLAFFQGFANARTAFRAYPDEWANKVRKPSSEAVGISFSQSV